MVESTCCFIGHRRIKESPELREKLAQLIDQLITESNIDTFLFGSKSEFNSLCYEMVTEAKEKHPHIRRIYIRAEFPYIDESYKSFLLERYEDTYFPEHMISAGKSVYVERNCRMINFSQICVFYYSPDYAPPKRKASRRSIAEYQPNSGTKIAWDHAVKKGKTVINVKI